MLVDLVGIEPTTSSMPWKRAPSCATGPLAAGKSRVENCEADSIFAYAPGIVNGAWPPVTASVLKGCEANAPIERVHDTATHYRRSQRAQQGNSN